MSKFWDIRAAAGTADIYIHGDIAFEKWNESDVTANSFREDLEAAGKVSQINLYVASLGGSFWQALAICAVLDRHPARVNGFVDGYAASAATLLLAVAETVSAPSNALLLYHAPLAGIMGYYDAAELRAMADDLDRLLPSMLATYQRKDPQMTMESMIDALLTDTWITASQAYDLGLVDVVTEDVVQIAAYASPFLDVYAQVPEELRAAPTEGAETAGPEHGLPEQVLVEAAQHTERIRKLREGMSFVPTRKEDC